MAVLPPVRRLAYGLADRPLALKGASALLACALLFVSGCGGSTSGGRRLVVKSGGGQTGFPGAECRDPVVVELMGPRVRGLLGGKGHRHPIVGARIVFSPLSEGDTISIVGSEVVATDAAGSARVRVALGKRLGDQYLVARVEEEPELSAVVRLVSGVEIKGDGQEVLAGQPLGNPIEVTVVDEGLGPTQGVPVHFTLGARPGKKGALDSTYALTDENGVARTQLTTDGKATGRYEVLVEISDRDRGFFVRGIRVSALALNRLDLAIGVLGGLGIFILGMKFMSEGLQRVAGSRLKSILQLLTRNRFAAVMAGAVITSLIQSSSACTVMVVGFVNAGMLSLQQAIGIVYGAAIGTTVTGQIVSLKLDCLALPAVAIGVAIILVAKTSTVQNWGQTLLGFGLLFLGMTMMSARLKGIAEFPSFIRFFATFDCRPGPSGYMPVGGVLGAIAIGTAMTMVIQSSSATIGLAIAMAASGLINFYTAVPLILGDNIGTTITALLASIGTNRPARQTAIAHTIFKMVGALYMAALFFVRVDGVPVFLHIVDLVTAGDVFAETPENIGRHIASAHTLFNVFNVLVFLPLVGALAWAAQRVLPEKTSEDARTVRLEAHLLDTPAAAIQQAASCAVDMLSDAWALAGEAFVASKQGVVPDVPEFVRREQAVDSMQHEITAYLVQLTRRELTEAQARTIPLLIHCVNDAERIGDHAMNLLDLARQTSERQTKFSKPARKDLDAMFELIAEQARCTIGGLKSAGGELAPQALALEEQVSRLGSEIDYNHIRRLEKGKCPVLSGVAFVDIVSNLERIAEHLTNIAERAGEIREQYVEL